MFRQGTILGSTFFASREPVRNPNTLLIVSTSKAIASKDPSLSGSMGHRLPRGLLATTDIPFATMTEGDIVEITDYDPVRRTSIVIGLKEPTVYAPLHWLALRTNPGLSASLLLLMDGPMEGIEVFESRLLHGSFEEAMEVAKALKANATGRIFLSGRGLFLVSKDLDSLARDIKAILYPMPKGPIKRKDTGPRRKGPSKEKGIDKKVGRKAARKAPGKGLKGRRHSQGRTRGRRRTHYKRGPTRRATKGRR
jgi:hypothetical protein